ncbi:MAG: hypothetical protein ABI863_24120 [Ginsengibacter sp.]
MIQTLIQKALFHIGTTGLKAGKFSCSPRLILMGKQNITGISDTIGNIPRRQAFAGYALLNISIRDNSTKQFSVFADITNALNRYYRSLGFNMDLNKKVTEVFYGQHEDAIGVMGGFNFNF